jgi:hypothetical protein
MDAQNKTHAPFRDVRGKLPNFSRSLPRTSFYDIAGINHLGSHRRELGCYGSITQSNQYWMLTRLKHNFMAKSRTFDGFKTDEGAWAGHPMAGLRVGHPTCPEEGSYVIFPNCAGSRMYLQKPYANQWIHPEWVQGDFQWAPFDAGNPDLSDLCCPGCQLLPSTSNSHATGTFNARAIAAAS